MEETTPEHDKRSRNDSGRRYEIAVAKGYVESVQSDARNLPRLGGLHWKSLHMEAAFLAGISWFMERRTCEWSYASDYDDDYWDTECGGTFCMIDGTWRDNGYKHCPNCGGVIWEDAGEE